MTATVTMSSTRVNPAACETRCALAICPYLCWLCSTNAAYAAPTHQLKILPPLWEAPLVFLLHLIPEIKELLRPGGDLALDLGLFVRIMGAGDFAIAFYSQVELRFDFFFLFPIGFEIQLGCLPSIRSDFCLRERFLLYLRGNLLLSLRGRMLFDLRANLLLGCTSEV